MISPGFAGSRRGFLGVVIFSPSITSGKVFAELCADALPARRAFFCGSR